MDGEVEKLTSLSQKNLKKMQLSQNERFKDCDEKMKLFSQTKNLPRILKKR